MRAVRFLSCLATLAGVPALAGSPEGIWETQPDRKGGFAHIRAYSCGDSICGTVLKAFNQEGLEIRTPNVGKQVFWDMKQESDGSYTGRAWVPAFKREYTGRMQLQGDRLKVGGCSGPICMSQSWKRVK